MNISEDRDRIEMLIDKLLQTPQDRKSGLTGTVSAIEAVSQLFEETGGRVITFSTQASAVGKY